MGCKAVLSRFCVSADIVASRQGSPEGFLGDDHPKRQTKLTFPVREEKSRLVDRPTVVIGIGSVSIGRRYRGENFREKVCAKALLEGA
jgi:hypothetical protein